MRALLRQTWTKILTIAAQERLPSCLFSIPDCGEYP
jgi:hypothetical protein